MRLVTTVNQIQPHLLWKPQFKLKARKRDQGIFPLVKYLKVAKRQRQCPRTSSKLLWMSLHHQIAVRRMLISLREKIAEEKVKKNWIPKTTSYSNQTSIAIILHTALDVNTNLCIACTRLCTQTKEWSYKLWSLLVNERANYRSWGKIAHV